MKRPIWIALLVEREHRAADNNKRMRRPVSVPSAFAGSWLSPTSPRVREQQGLRVHQRLPDLGDLPASVHRGQRAHGTSVHYVEAGINTGSATGRARRIADRQYVPGHGAALT